MDWRTPAKINPAVVLKKKLMLQDMVPKQSSSCMERRDISTTTTTMVAHLVQIFVGEKWSAFILNFIDIQIQVLVQSNA